jgi:hypothetical protein
MSTSESTLLDDISAEVADKVCRMVAELPDRDSPGDQPEMMLVTHQELRDIVCQAIEDADTEWLASQAELSNLQNELADEKARKKTAFERELEMEGSIARLLERVRFLERSQSDAAVKP